MSKEESIIIKNQKTGKYSHLVNLVAETDLVSKKVLQLSERQANYEGQRQTLSTMPISGEEHFSSKDLNTLFEGQINKVRKNR